MTETQKTTLLEVAKGLVGKPFRYGAKPEEAPNLFDCSSFTQYVFKQVGIELPRSAVLQAGDLRGEEIAWAPDFSNLEPGDLIFSRGVVGHYKDELFGGRPIDVGHVALYLGGGRIIHTREKLGGVREQNLPEMLAEPKYVVALVKRF